MWTFGRTVLNLVWKAAGRQRPARGTSDGKSADPGAPREADFAPGIYWHVTERHPTNFMFNNVWVRRGRLESMSATRARHDKRLITLGDVSPWIGAEAEAVWEAARAEYYPDKPSRDGALFLFDSEPTAGIASDWRPNSDTVLLKVRILRDARVHRGDLNWLETAEADWQDAATRYWAGESRDARSAIWEYVVDGGMYFPDWQEPPIGPFEGSKAASKDTDTINSPEIVTCPMCGIKFEVAKPNLTSFMSADRVHCVDNPDLPILNDCPHVAQLVEAAWNRLKPVSD